MIHFLNQNRVFTHLILPVFCLLFGTNLTAQSQYFSPMTSPTKVETTKTNKLKLKTILSVEATRASTSFEIIDADATLHNIEQYAEMFITENEHLTELTWQELSASGLPELRSPEVDGVLAHQTIERTGIKPQVGFGLSLYNQFFNVDVLLKNGKYNLMSLAIEGQFGVSARVIYKVLDYQSNSDFIQMLLNSPKFGVIAGYDGSYNPLTSIYQNRSNKHFNAFIGLDFPVLKRFNVYFIAALDMTKREEVGGQSFSRLGAKMSF